MMWCSQLPDCETNQDKALLMYYAHLTRHYESVRPNDYGFWEMPSFSLIKVGFLDIR